MHSDGGAIAEVIAPHNSDADEIAALHGVGPKTAPLFRELGIRSGAELLEYLPFRYDDLRFPTAARQLGESGGEENAVGRVVGVKERRVRGLEIVEARLTDDAGDPFAAKWIGRNRYVYGRFREGMRLFVRGRVERTLSGPVVSVSHYAQLGEDERYRGELVPIYPASKVSGQSQDRDGLAKKFAAFARLGTAGSFAPIAGRRSRVRPLEDAYRAVHAPRTPEEAERARERFVFAEFLALATAAQLRRSERERDHDARALRVPSGLLERFEETLPFALTGAQRRVVVEIWSDMSRDIPMNRLLQGDVGSGKTLVAAAAVLLAARNGMQSALMAPTELLAWQHANKLAPLLLPFGVTLEAVFGSQSARSRNAALEKLAAVKLRSASAHTRC